MKRICLIGLIVCGVAFAGTLPNGTQVRRGTVAPTNTLLAIGEFGWVPASSNLYIGGTNGATIWVGTGNPASTNDIRAAFQNLPLVILSNATLAVTNEVEIVTIGVCAITLPAVSTGRVVYITKRDDGPLLTVNGGTIENDGAGAAISTRFSGGLLCDGEKWWVK